MNTISLGKYSPIISDKDSGDEIYSSIKDALSSEGPVTIDMDEIKSMATFCAKQIFGMLYLEIGSIDFFHRLIFINTSEDLKSIIRVGIQNAIEEKKGK
jgi:hypothetical protein